MTDWYQEQYKTETGQIHAPQSLIEKTKAAVREEERRLAVSQTEDANRQKQMRAFSVRKWAYPLTAAAAILILASVSLTMRGLKSVNEMTASDTAYSGAADTDAAVAESAADAGGFYEEAAAEAPAAEAVEIPMIEEEAPEEAAADDVLADMTEGAVGAGGLSEAESADAGQTNGLSQKDALAGMTAPAEEKSMGESAENAERELADKVPQKSTTDAQKREAAEERQRGDIDYDDYTIEKVTKRPARFSGSDVKIRRYEGKTYRILETTSEGNGAKAAWEAYVEESAGGGYVICGEAESVDDFLAAAHKKLEEEKE